MNLTTVDAVSYLLENNLHFRVSVTPPELKQILLGFGRYNSILAYLPDIVKDLEKIGIGSLDRVEIGNEYSLVLYVSKYQPKNQTETARKLEALGKKYAADEYDATVDGSRVNLRLWWD